MSATRPAATPAGRPSRISASASGSACPSMASPVTDTAPSWNTTCPDWISSASLNAKAMRPFGSIAGSSPRAARSRSSTVPPAAASVAARRAASRSAAEGAKPSRTMPRADFSTANRYAATRGGRISTRPTLNPSGGSDRAARRAS